MISGDNNNYLKDYKISRILMSSLTKTLNYFSQMLEEH